MYRHSSRHSGEPVYTGLALSAPQLSGTPGASPRGWPDADADTVGTAGPGRRGQPKSSAHPFNPAKQLRLPGALSQIRGALISHFLVNEALLIMQGSGRFLLAALKSQGGPSG